MICKHNKRGILPKALLPASAALHMAGTLPFAALCGVTALSPLLLPHAVRAQAIAAKPPIPAADTHRINLVSYASSLPRCPMLVVSHNGNKYLFNCTLRDSGKNIGVSTVYEVRVQGSDKVYQIGKDFGNASTDKLKCDIFTMPYAAVEIDQSNLLIVYSSPTGNGYPRINVENVDEMLKGQGASVNRYAGPVNDDLSQDTNSHGIGAVAIPRPGASVNAPKLGILAAFSSGNAVELRPFKYENKTINGKSMGNATFPLPSDNPKAHGWGGDVAVQLINNPDKADTAHPFVVYVALTRNDGIQVGRVLMSSSGEVVKPDAITMKWSLIKTGQGTQFIENPVTPCYVTINKGLFGDVSINYLNTNYHQREIALIETSAAPMKGTGQGQGNEWANPIELTADFYAADRGFPLRNRKLIAENPNNPAYAGAGTLTGKVHSPAAAVYYPDSAHAKVVPDSNNPTLSSVYVPVMSSQVYMLAGQITETVSQIGWAQRRIINPVPAGKQVLIGIIEGPPPYPAVNLNLPDDADFRGPVFAVSSVTSTNKNDAKAGVSASFTNTTMAKWNGKALAGGIGIATEGEWNMSTSTLTDHQQNTSLMYSYAQSLTAQGDSTANYKARPEATLITFGVSWGGYAYDVVDEKNARIPGVAEFIEMYPLPAATRAHTVYLNPNGVRPGDLYSYMKPNNMTQADWDAKVKGFDEASMIDGPNGVHYIENGWSPSGTVNSAYEASSSDTVDKGGSMSLSSLSGVTVEQEVKTGFLGIVEATAVKAELTALAGSGFTSTGSFSTGAGKTQGLTCSTDIRGNADFGGCVSFGYRVYQLRPSNQYTRDLFNESSTSAGLVTTNGWPTNPVYRSENKRILDLIDPKSTPWKITYVVTGAQIYPLTRPSGSETATTRVLQQQSVAAPGTARVAAANTATANTAGTTDATNLPAPLKEKLDAAGLSTPGLIGTSYKAAFEADAKQKERAQAVLDKMEAFKNKQANLAAFGSGKSVAIMKALSPSEKKAVEDYLAAQAKIAREQYEQQRAAQAE